MSSEISQLISYVGSQGLQDISRFGVIIAGNDFSKSVLSVKMPGPKVEFMRVSYWQPNPEFYFPTGIKYPEQLIIEMLIPETSSFVAEQANFLNYLPTYMINRFTYGNKGVFLGNAEGEMTKPFYWDRKTTNNNDIEIIAYNRNDAVNKRYTYFNCFLEKILPMEFDTAKSDIQTFTASFVVGGMKQHQS